MNRIAKFQKVSFEQYLEDYVRLFPDTDVESQDVLNQIKEQFDAIQLPKRATAGSAGYDFYSPVDFTLQPKAENKFIPIRDNIGQHVVVLNNDCTITIPTGIRCQIDESYVLFIAPRSSLGFKYEAMLANTLGVIDADYFFANNEGHIMAKIVNNGNRMLEVKAGDRFMQGIFLPYGITYDDEILNQRIGGFGSTGL